MTRNINKSAQECHMPSKAFLISLLPNSHKLVLSGARLSRSESVDCIVTQVR